jgi:two-component system phosphate regulon sensor histidine kinase PhoR
MRRGPVNSRTARPVHSGWMARAHDLRARPRPLIQRLLLWHAIAILGVLLVLGVVADRVLERYFVGQLTDSLASEARVVDLVLPRNESLEPEVQALGRAIAARVTIIRMDGQVLADSEHDPATMENHRTRPEVRQALEGKVGTATRKSATIGIAFRYVALPPAGGRIVRLALPLTQVQTKLGTLRVILIVGFGAAALAGLLVLWAIASRLSRPLSRIARAAEQIGSGDLSVEVPEEGSEELVLLARSLNRMRDEVANRMAEMDRDRSTREAILSSMEEGVLLFDRDGSIVYQNDRARQLLGGRLDGARGLSQPALRDLVARAASGETPPPVEVAAGRIPRTLLASALPIEDGQTLMVLRDVTQAQMIDAVRRDFVANASHELKTPVASIQALAETLVTAASSDPDEVPRFASQLELEAIRLSRIVTDLLDLSRLEGEAGLRADVRLDRLVAEESDRLRERAAEGGLHLVERLEQPVLVRGSARDLSLLARNLLDNAVQYTRSGGTIEISVRRETGTALLSVRDTGIGIPARDRSRIFERFYRVDRARSRETGGTGLGLSIVKHIVENHRGTVEVESELGQGSTFTVRLPAPQSRSIG